MKREACKLIGPALNWAVAMAAGIEPRLFGGVVWNDQKRPFCPATSWLDAGPIIERERIQISPVMVRPQDGWTAHYHDCLFNEDGSDHASTGPTPLVAAMRCYVACKLGDTVDIPDNVKEAA